MFLISLLFYAQRLQGIWSGFHMLLNPVSFVTPSQYSDSLSDVFKQLPEHKFQHHLGLLSPAERHPQVFLLMKGRSRSLMQFLVSH